MPHLTRSPLTLRVREYIILQHVVHPASTKFMSWDNQFTFDPHKKGLRKILGDLESDIMEIVWARKEASVRDVHLRLESQRDLAYTTVMTVMSRLAEKGLLRKRKDGAAFLYSPALSREAFTNGVVGRLIGELLEDFTAPTLSQFVDSVEEQSPEVIDALAEEIERKRKERDA